MEKKKINTFMYVFVDNYHLRILLISNLEANSVIW